MIPHYTYIVHKTDQFKKSLKFEFSNLSSVSCAFIIYAKSTLWFVVFIACILKMQSC